MWLEHIRTYSIHSYFQSEGLCLLLEYTRAGYRGALPTRNTCTVGPYSSPTPRDLWWSGGGGQALLSEVLLYDWAVFACQKASRPRPRVGEACQVGKPK